MASFATSSSFIGDAMVMRPILRKTFRRFARREDGVALVELAVTLPLILLVFAVIIEGSRTFWAYQSVISAVRDATRYAARAAGTDTCGPLNAVTPRVADIVNESIMPGAVTVDTVEAWADCPAIAGLRTELMPVATVTATITIAMPFAGIFRLAGTDLGAVTTTVSNSTRVYSQ